MIAIPEVVESIVQKSVYLSEALSLGIINISALARLIKPEVEKQVLKDIQEGAVIMALNRLAQKIHKKTRSQKKIFVSAPNLIVRSNLIEITFSNSSKLLQKQRELLEQIGARQNYFITITQGIFETTVISSQELKNRIQRIFAEEKIISQIDNLSSLTILLPQGTALIPGAYNYILKILAWKGINIIEVVSTYNEFTLILENHNIDKAFSFVKQMF